MKRIILMVLRLGPKAVYFYLVMWFYSIQKKKDYVRNYAWVKKATVAANKAGRVTIETYGLENIPKENGFIFFPNHQGLYDVLAFFESCPAPFAFIIKKEASNLILLKQVMNAVGGMSIDREDIRQSMEVIMKMTEEVKKGRNLLIFAEGTRSRKGNQVGEFKGGSFKSAVKAKCPIVPCAIIDAFVPFDEKHTHPVTVKIVYLKPMLYEEYAGMRTVEIATEVRGRIEEAIKDKTSNKI